MFPRRPTKFAILYEREILPISSRNICLKCFFNPSTVSQLMGNLLPERVNHNFAFHDTEIDFCELFHVKYKNERKGVFNKVYVATFVCLAIRTIHLEITDLCTYEFISCLKRFFTRGSKSRKFFTYNAQTFVGATAELMKLFN